MPDGDRVGCPFCDRIAGDGPFLAAADSAVAFEDGFPVSPGHTLVVPRSHVPDLFDLEADEIAAVWRLVGLMRDELARDRCPDGFNVGVNAGAAAGQTVWHAHVHVIPRYVGDAEDPRGGIRRVIPKRARYWR